jgi:hypothetical protein
MSSSSNVAGKKKGKVKNVTKKREMQAQKKEDDWAIWYAARHGHLEEGKNLGKAIVMKGENSWRSKKGELKKQQVIKKAKNLEVQSEGTGIELEGKGNEDDDGGERLGDEHTSMSSDEDMQAEIEEHLKREETQLETQNEMEETQNEKGEETQLVGEGSENEQHCSDCGEQRPERGIVECKACGSKN